jgi:hypothetical protein
MTSDLSRASGADLVGKRNGFRVESYLVVPLVRPLSVVESLVNRALREGLLPTGPFEGLDISSPRDRAGAPLKIAL